MSPKGFSKRISPFAGGNILSAGDACCAETMADKQRIEITTLSSVFEKRWFIITLMLWRMPEVVNRSIQLFHPVREQNLESRVTPIPLTRLTMAKQLGLQILCSFVPF
ncbi:MAG: hypothetical protein LC803_17500 [Acidobacteria bacterium]|nr:hypothetical protein [Acidobacteriota bacterium]